MIVKLDNAGATGLNLDLPAYEIPDSAWSDGRNVRFNNGMIERSSGYSAQFGAPGHIPYGLFYALSGTGVKYIVYPGLTAIRAVQGTTHYDITRSSGGAYAATADKRWTGAVFTGIVIVNNGVDDPQYWVPQNGGNMALLTNWPGSTKCNVLRSYRDYLVALDITEVSTRYPYRVKWSAAAASGSLPSSWDETDATKDSGEYDLGDSMDFIVDAFPIGDSLAIYREGSIHLMRWIGGQNIMNFVRVSGEAGMLANNCAGQFPGGHVVLGQGDVYVFNGTPAIKSIVDGRMRNWLFNRIDSTYYKRSFVVENARDNEVWICFPENGAASCTLALVWNYKYDTLNVNEIPNVTAGICSQIDQVGAATWTTGSETWTTGSEIWNSDGGSLAAKRLVLGNTASKLMVIGVGTGFDSASYTSTVERSGISLGDPESVKFVRKVFPKFEGSGTVEISIGTQMAPDEAVTWGAAQTYTIGTSRYVDLNATGKFIGLRLRSASATNTWRLKSMEVDVAPMGKW